MDFQKMVVDEKFDVLTKKNFFVNTGYEWGRGLEQSKTEAFFDEVYKKVYREEYMKDGWEWKDPESSGHCPIITKKGREIYIHPMEFSVTGNEKDFEKIRGILNEKDFDTFTFAGKIKHNGMNVYQGESNGYGVYYDMTEEQLKQTYLDNKPVIKYNIMSCIRNGFTNHNEIHEKVMKVCELEVSHVYGLGFKTFNDCMDELQKSKLIEKNDGKYRVCKKHKDMYFIRHNAFSSKEWKNYRANMDSVITLKSKSNDDIMVITMPKILKKREEDVFVSEFIENNKKDLMILNHLKNTFESVPEKYPDIDSSLFNAPKLEASLKDRWKNYCVETLKTMGYER